MFRKIFFIFAVIVFSTQIAYSKDVLVQIRPVEKITTSNPNLKEGDSLNFVVDKDVYLNSKLYLKRGEQVVGIITSLEENGFTCKEASIYVENFRVKNTDGKEIKLNGIIYQKGRDHALFTQFLPLVPELIRGGEVQVDPEKDTFMLYLEAI